jgi:hypothetical protein
MKKNNILIASAATGDYFLKPEIDFENFKRIYAHDVTFVENPKGLPYDGKVNITPGEASEKEFLSFLRKYNERVSPGGGGRNSAEILKREGFDVFYFDTSKKPEFDLLVGNNVYHADMAEAPRALVFKTAAGTLNLRSLRGDKERMLPDKFKRDLVGMLATGMDCFVNSISNEDLAVNIARNARGGLYTLITDHIPRGSWRMHELIQRSNSLFFSYADFYTFSELNPRGNKDQTMDVNVTSKIADDIAIFAKERALNSPVFVTLGKNGAIAHDPTLSREGSFRVYLDPKEEVKLKKYMDEKGIGTNKSGDTFAAKVIDNVTNGMTMLEAVKDATMFVIKNLYRYDTNSKNIKVDIFDPPIYPEDIKNRIVGDVHTLEHSKYPEYDVLN